jgi:hypothetical protein
MLSLKFHPQMVTGIQDLQNSYESTHGPKLPENHFQKVKNYITSYKIKMHYDYTGRAHTCAIEKHRKSAHAHDARLWTLKVAHT